MTPKKTSIESKLLKKLKSIDKLPCYKCIAQPICISKRIEDILACDLLLPVFYNLIAHVPVDRTYNMMTVLNLTIWIEKRTTFSAGIYAYRGSDKDRPYGSGTHVLFLDLDTKGV